MSGFYNRVTEDGAYVAGRDRIDQDQYDYVLNRNAVMRGNLAEAPFMMPGQNVSFYGPLAGNRVTKDSFMQGRGTTLSKDPNNEVNYLPVSLFNQPQLKSSCDRVDLLPLFTRLKPSCNGLKESNITQYYLRKQHIQPNDWLPIQKGTTQAIQSI